MIWLVKRTVSVNNIVEEHKIVKVLVESLLESDERTRNSDLWLILRVWQEKQHIKVFVPYDKLDEMIAPETVTRCRRLIQNTEGKLLPTKPEVLVRRRMNEESIRKYYASQPEILDKFKSAKEHQNG